MVLALLGLMAGLIVSRVDLLLPAYRLRLAGREIAATVTWARSESLGSARAVALRYDVADGEYWVAQPAEGVPSASAFEPPDRRLRLKKLPEGVRFDGVALFGTEAPARDSALVRFSALGACAGHRVYLSDGEGNAFTVEVMPLAAQVNLYDSHREDDHAAAP